MTNQIYCNQCGTVNDVMFHHCLTCGNPIGELLYSPHEPKVKVPTLNNVEWHDEDFVLFYKAGNGKAEKGGELF